MVSPSRYAPSILWQIIETRLPLILAPIKLSFSKYLLAPKPHISRGSSLPIPDAYDFTVAICTYNGSLRLPDVLEGLARQQGLPFDHWEILVIDNNSDDKTAEVVAFYQQKYPYLNLRYTTETRQGAAYARHRAMDEAQSSLIGFLDDDNLPLADWVASAYRFATDHPEVGVISSRIRGDFQGTPPLHFERIAAFMALTDRGDRPIPYNSYKRLFPPGAGLVVRRALWQAHVSRNPLLAGSTRHRVVSGEDLEAVIQLYRAGVQIWYNPAMQVRHVIPARRLQRPQLLRLMRGIGYSRHRTRSLSLAWWQRPLFFLAYQGNDLFKVVCHLLRHRRDSWRDTVAACELTLYCTSFLSPYYLWFYQLKTWVQGWIRGSRG